MNNTRLQKLYRRYSAETIRIFEGHLAILSGYWVPQGNNMILGDHPEGGLIMGVRSGRFMADLTLLLRFLNSREGYEYISGPDRYRSRSFRGYYAGIDIGYQLYRQELVEINLLAGVGYDGFTGGRSEASFESGSLNINPGVGVRYYFSRYTSRYFGFQVRTNFARYKNPGGTDLSGNAVSFRMILAFSANVYKYDRLKKLRYIF